MDTNGIIFLTISLISRNTAIYNTLISSLPPSDLNIIFEELTTRNVYVHKFEDGREVRLPNLYSSSDLEVLVLKTLLKSRNSNIPAYLRILFILEDNIIKTENSMHSLDDITPSEGAILVRDWVSFGLYDKNQV